MTFFLPKISMYKFRETCRIDQATTKIIDLMTAIDEFNIEMDSNIILARKHPKLFNKLSNDSLQRDQMYLFILGLFVNVIVLTKFEHTDEGLAMAPGNL
jgi:hypothetical protein